MANLPANLSKPVEDRDREKIYSKRIRAGKRTYFFDVKATRSNDYYLTITESRRQGQGESYTYEKQKLFLYKEDFDKFLEALQETLCHVKTELMPEVDFSQFAQRDRDQLDDLSTELKWD
ncbi:DUF3276 family protein [uncultured Spirosoma sp.]|uniref:DUF3276 family protein n=1 Tax=uncultured Spirosoma sp. TaxID=278208 RepID=UPI00258D2AA5|nr:DUF3276 family protein [uncultured Spirosoma sp.]